MFHDLVLALWNCADGQTIQVIRVSNVYHLFASLHSLNCFHFCFYGYHLAQTSSTVTSLLLLGFASRHPGLEIKILYCLLYTVQ